MDLEQFAQHRIVFEGRELPKAALFLDHLGMHQNLPGISEDTSEWLWRFVICIGRTREDRSDRVIRCSSEALRLCRQHRDHLVTSFAAHFRGQPEPDFYAGWIWSLECMNAVAKERPLCRWVAPLLPGDANYGRPEEEVRAEMAQNLERAIAAATKRPWWQFWR